MLALVVAIDTNHYAGSDFSGQIFAWNINRDDRAERETTLTEYFSDYSINFHRRVVAWKT